MISTDVKAKTIRIENKKRKEKEKNWWLYLINFYKKYLLQNFKYNVKSA